MTKFRMFKYTVEGFGVFPFDMLRYDESFPHAQEDSLGLDSQLNRKRRQVTLIHTTIGASNWHPCEDRWESFLWKVTNAEEML